MDYGVEPTTTEDSVEKPRSRVGLALVVGVVAALAVFMISSGPQQELASADEEPVTTSTVPISTALTLATGADTIGSDEGRSEPQPDRGAFRAALVNRLTEECDALIDGPEPVAAGLYETHAQCIAEALYDLDERCMLAAAVFYVMPGDEALTIACDIDPDQTQDFRESVRQSMVISCDRELSNPEAQETYYEYERCLKKVEVDLDQICYLAARAQYAQPVDSNLRRDCDIGQDVALASTVGD